MASLNSIIFTPPPKKQRPPAFNVSPPRKPMLKAPFKHQILLRSAVLSQTPMLNSPEPPGVEPAGPRNQTAYVDLVMGMKIKAFAKMVLGLALLQLASPSSLSLAQSQLQRDAPDTNTISPEIAQASLENAAGKVLAPPATDASPITPLEPAAEVVRLAQAGLDESVMLSYVTNSPNKFALDSQRIIYLTDIGVPSAVITAMLQHDATVTNTLPAPRLVQPVAPPPPPAAAPLGAGSTTAAVEDPAAPPAPINPSYTYFYDSLSPYGSWIDVEGYGLCWQPTVMAVNRGWQPYFDHGHWVNSDCGWYWSSGYSWGWAPFHYGRWFRHNRWGWCWAPDTVWGPSWVTWRYNDAYCGWAPLPPTACFRPGLGFTFWGHPVGWDFTFGLGVGWFNFVAIGDVCSPHPWQHRLPAHEAVAVYSRTVVSHQIVEGRNHEKIHRGLPAEHIIAKTRGDLRPVRVHETTDLAKATRIQQTQSGGRSITAFRPNLPQPSATHQSVWVGGGIKPAPPNSSPARSGSGFTGSGSLFDSGVKHPVSTRPSHRSETVPVFKTFAPAPANNPSPAVNPGSAPKPASGRIESSPNLAHPAERISKHPPLSPASFHETSADSEHRSGLTVDQPPVNNATTARQPEVTAPLRTTPPRQKVWPEQRVFVPQNTRTWQSQQQPTTPSLAPAAKINPSAPSVTAPANQLRPQPQWTAPIPRQNLERPAAQHVTEPIMAPAPRPPIAPVHPTPAPQPGGPANPNQNQHRPDNNNSPNPRNGR